jgi:dTMP kinase
LDDGATLAAVSPSRSAVRGAFITIEGPEGAGKTSQAERLRSRAAEAGIDVVLTREPGGTPLGEGIRGALLDPGARHDPRTDALLFNAARAQLVRDVIGPALDRGTLVICARFADSTAAYQGHGAGLPIGDLRAVERFATGGLRPDRTILLDLPVEVGLARKGGERTRFETVFDLDFHRRVREGFLAMARAEPDRFRVIDASADADEVFDDVLRALADLSGLDRLAHAGPSSEPSRLGERIHR